jgi:hypothetical protein
MSLQEFRDKYPQYDDVDDSNLAQALYNKHGKEGESYPSFLQDIRATHLMDVGDETEKRSIMQGDPRPGPEPTSPSTQIITQENVENVADVDPDFARQMIRGDQMRYERDVDRIEQDSWDTWINANRRIAELTPTHEEFREAKASEPRARTPLKREQIGFEGDLEYGMGGIDEGEPTRFAQIGEGTKDVIRNSVTGAVVMLERSQREYQEQVQNAAVYTDDILMKSTSPFEVRELAAKMGAIEEERGSKFTQEEKREFFRSHLIDSSRQKVEDAQKARDYIKFKYEADPRYFETTGFLEDVLRMGPQIGAQVVASLVTGGIGGAAVMGLQIVGSKYEERIQMGDTPEEASNRAVISALVQAPLEQIGIGKTLKFFKKGAARRIKNIVDVMGTEWTTEFMQAHADHIADVVMDKKGDDKVEALNQWLDGLWQVTKKGSYEGLVAMVLPGAGVAAKVTAFAALNQIVDNVIEKEATKNIAKREKLRVPKDRKDAPEDVDEYYKGLVEEEGEKDEPTKADKVDDKSAAIDDDEGVSTSEISEAQLRADSAPVSEADGIDTELPEASTDATKKSDVSGTPSDVKRAARASLKPLIKDWGPLAKRVKKAEKAEELAHRDTVTGAILNAPQLREQMRAEGIDPKPKRR